MNVAIVTNLNGIGLQRDAELLGQFLIELGHKIVTFQYDADYGDYALRYDLAIFLEVAPRNLLNLSERRWFVANPELLKPDRIQVVQRNFEKVFAKTHEAKRLLDPIFPGRVHYVGWLCRDQYDSSVKREPWFLHVGGNSSLRGTQAVVDAWKWKKNGKRLDAKLCIVSSVIKDIPVAPNIFGWTHLSEEDLKKLQNQCMFHLYPSQTEGYGHAIHEAQGVGATLILSLAPPMDEIHAEHDYFIEATKNGKCALADLYEVSALLIYNAVELCSAREKFYIQERRKLFLADNQAFKEAFAEHLKETPTFAPAVITRERKKDQKSIAFIGNFEAEHSTENQILWALEQRLGYDVELLQENRVTFAQLEEAVKWNDALIWVKTPGWLKISDDVMLSLIMEMENKRSPYHKPTISIHLDKFWGIPEREEQIGIHPFWKMQYVWTADGSRQEDFKKRGVNHFWMRPAVSEVYCHPGTPREQYKCDVLFVGAKGYHKEYPFREQMVNFLEQEYGERFKHIQGIRGHELNDVYASAKVVVGDCIFAGTPRYWSDRLPETYGRYGFLLHPQVEGIDESVATYKPQDLNDLKTQIEEWLKLDVARSIRTIRAAEMVHHCDTWNSRMMEILKDAGL